MLIESQKVELCENAHLPHRQRWGFMFYVAARVQSKERVSIPKAIDEFKNAFGIETDETALRTEYYRLLELHKNCLKNGI